MRKTILSLVLLPLVATLPACFQFEIQAQAGYAQLALDGDIGYQNGAQSGDIDQDIESAFGLGDDQGSPYVRAKLDFGVPNLSVSAFTFEDEGEGTLEANFGNVPQNVPVRSQFDLSNAKAAYAFEIPIVPGIASISPGIAIDYFDLAIDVRDAFGISQENVELAGPLPLAFVRGEVDLGIVSAVVEGGYITADIDDVEGEVLDLEAQLLLHPTDLIEIFVGYRSLNLDLNGMVDGDTFDTDITLSGFMIGGGFRF
ncbi:MAG: hypothetical protein KAI24_23600 [Planctomycetes bacterium]|nr:hypothetical protein [Planctomycetota bacterium]